MFARQTNTADSDTQDMREMISQGYRPIERPSCTGQRDADGRPIVLCIWSRPRKSGRILASLSR